MNNILNEIQAKINKSKRDGFKPIRVELGYNAANQLRESLLDICNIYFDFNSENCRIFGLKIKIKNNADFDFINIVGEKK